MYNQFSEVVFTELDSFLKIRNISKSTKRRYRNNKPYWSDDLKIMWKKMRYAENSFLKHNKNGSKKIRDHLRSQYITKRHTFHKALRQAERKYNRG